MMTLAIIQIAAYDSSSDVHYATNQFGGNVEKLKAFQIPTSGVGPENKMQKMERKIRDRKSPAED